MAEPATYSAFHAGYIALLLHPLPCSSVSDSPIATTIGFAAPFNQALHHLRKCFAAVEFVVL